MSNQLLPLNSQTHATHGYALAKDYLFAKSDTVMPIMINEISSLLPIFVLAFVKDKNDNFTLVTLQGMYYNDNIFIDENGKWKIKIMPSTYKAHPFVLADSPDKENILCFKKDSGLYRETPNTDNGELRFFDDEGKLNNEVKNVLSFLSETTKYKKMTINAIQTIKNADILEQWDIELEKSNPNKTPLRGLYKINQQKLNNLNAEELEKLNKSNALSIAYAQILSIPRLEILSALYNVKNQKEEKAKEEEFNLDAFFGEANNDSLNFDF